MKKILATVAVVGCLSAAGTALAGVAAGTGVNGSLHDMNMYPKQGIGGQRDVMDRVCVYCHTPHHADVIDGTANLPLWNHDLTPDNEFTAYTWATPTNSADGVFDIVDPLAGPSRLCMSCHDGSIAVDQHGSAYAQAGGLKVGDIFTGIDYTGRANLTKDLSNTHPIGFDYNDIAAYRNSRATRGDQADATMTEIVWATYPYATALNYSQDQGVYNEVLRGEVAGVDGSGNPITLGSRKLIADNLYGGSIMTCATCHEVHNKENSVQDTYQDGYNVDVFGENQTAPNYFLYAKQTDSLICLSCHIK